MPPTAEVSNSQATPPRREENALLYRRVAEELVQDIRQGLYQAGQKVPSVRKLASHRQVSISTVTQAYALLEDRGVLLAKPQSGYFVRAGIDEPPVAPPISPGDKPSVVTRGGLIRQMLANSQRHSAVSLGAAIPARELLPARSIQTHLQKAARFQGDDTTNYQFAPGYGPLRQQIARRMRHIGVRCHQQEVVITNGCTEALNLCLRASTSRGDTVAVESPCYYGFLQMAEALGLKVVEIPTDPNNGMSIEALQLALQQWSIKLVLLSSRFSNPTGCSMPPQRQQQLVALLEQYDIGAIEDDIYGELGFDGSGQHTLKSFDKTGRVMYCASFSKTVAPGLRVGWCLPGKQLEAVTTLQTFSTLAPASLPQLAMASYLEQGQYDKHLRKLRRSAQDNIERASATIRKHFPQPTMLSQPAGGYVLWVCLPPGVVAMELQRAAGREGITIVPGDVFSNTAHFANYIRINCALPWQPAVTDALVRLGEMVAARCP